MNELSTAGGLTHALFGLAVISALIQFSKSMKGKGHNNIGVPNSFAPEKP